MTKTHGVPGSTEESPRLGAIEAFIGIEGGNVWNNLHGLQSVAVRERKAQLEALPTRLSTKDALLQGETVTITHGVPQKKLEVRWEELPAFRERMEATIAEAKSVFERLKAKLPQGAAYALTNAIGACEGLQGNVEHGYDPERNLRTMEMDLFGRNNEFVRTLKAYDDSFGRGIDPDVIREFERDAKSTADSLWELNRYHEVCNEFETRARQKQQPERDALRPDVENTARAAATIDGKERNPADTRANADAVWHLAQFATMLKSHPDFLDRSEAQRILENICTEAYGGWQHLERTYGQREEFLAAKKAVQEIMRGVPEKATTDSADVVETERTKSRGIFQRWFGGK